MIIVIQKHSTTSLKLCVQLLSHGTFFLPGSSVFKELGFSWQTRKHFRDSSVHWSRFASCGQQPCQSSGAQFVWVERSVVFSAQALCFVQNAIGFLGLGKKWKLSLYCASPFALRKVLKVCHTLRFVYYETNLEWLNPCVTQRLNHFSFKLSEAKFRQSFRVTGLIYIHPSLFRVSKRA